MKTVAITMIMALPFPFLQSNNYPFFFQPSATSDLWSWDPSEHQTSSGKCDDVVSDLFGALKPLANVSLPSCRNGANIGPEPSLPPLPQLPSDTKPPTRSLEDICKFYSNSISKREASVQPLATEPAFFFRSFTDTEASQPLHTLQTAITPPQHETSHVHPTLSSAEDVSGSSIWQDPRILLEPPPPHCEPCSLSPLLSMLPPDVMASGALILDTVLAVFDELVFAVLAWLLPRNDADIIDESVLHRHCFSALIGVPSPIFTLNHSTCSLEPALNSIRLEDVSPAALRNALIQFSQAGTAALRISYLAAHASASSTALPFTVKSLIFFSRMQLLALCQVRWT